MPYIKQEIRVAVLEGTPISAGELNYKITHAITDYMEGKIINYEFLNGIIGALESAKLEFYRRVVVPYEEQKRFENGDVYADE